MIIKTAQEDIFNTEAKHIAFSINTEGTKYAGFAEEFASKYWPELKRLHTAEIGTVLSKKIGEKTYHALICHTLENGWGIDQADIIRQCFNAIPANGEVIATIAIGTRFPEKILGADFRQIIYGMHDSNQQIMLHTDHAFDYIMKMYQKVKKENPQKIKHY